METVEKRLKEIMLDYGERYFEEFRLRAGLPRGFLIYWDVKISPRMKDDVAGCCNYEYKTIELGKKLLENENILREVLIHEMVHIYESSLLQQRGNEALGWLNGLIQNLIGGFPFADILSEYEKTKNAAPLHYRDFIFLCISLYLDTRLNLPHGSVLGNGFSEIFSRAMEEGRKRSEALGLDYDAKPGLYK